ncbi:hypothetical protein BJ508DRAFT_417392 [Ascobolus immersus RN42]|uniref:Uncharacterized protein n=1 Tax=Ascobolus immersus RN42 TaxID=1160509 RepID=A0A3N4HWL2_ASCIM|nr:hypothetical protein BJ508DRAFT_417392 [Ascobolus immersus RN42]
MDIDLSTIPQLRSNSGNEESCPCRFSSCGTAEAARPNLVQVGGDEVNTGCEDGPKRHPESSDDDEEDDEEDEDHDDGDDDDDDDEDENEDEDEDEDDDEDDGEEQDASQGRIGSAEWDEIWREDEATPESNSALPKKYKQILKDCHPRLIGPNWRLLEKYGTTEGHKNIAWSVGHPGSRIKNTLEIIPHGVGAAAFLEQRYLDEGKLPFIYNEPNFAFHHHDLTVYLAKTSNPIPTIVTGVSQRLSPASLYSNVDMRPEYSQEIVTFRYSPPAVKGKKKQLSVTSEKYRTALEAFMRDAKLHSGRTLFRGLTRLGLERGLQFLVPVPSPHTSELGSGIYATEYLEEALTYAGGNGAIMVFDNPDDQPDLKLYTPIGKDWTDIIKRNCWSRYDGKVPDDFLVSDIVRAQTAQNIDEVLRRTKPDDPIPHKDARKEQYCFRSFKALPALRAGLKAIVYLE